MIRVLLFVFIGLLTSCSSVPKEVVTKEEQIINESIEAHGGKTYENCAYSFTFRDQLCSFKHEDARYTYTMKQSKNNRDVVYYLDNDRFYKTINGDTLKLSDKDIVRNANSLNSIIYFALLPYRLNDPAVIKTYKGTTTIKEQKYEVVEVRFKEENGGSDHEDVFYYWINAQTSFMDYLAYEFHVNGGGIRFRSAFNPRVVDGIRFQDYENYSAPIDTPFAALPELYEKGELKLLSKIELEQVKSL